MASCFRSREEDFYELSKLYKRYMSGDAHVRNYDLQTLYNLFTQSLFNKNVISFTGTEGGQIKGFLLGY